MCIRDRCEVYYVDRESLSINVYKEEVEKYNLNTSYGLSFRGKMGDRIGYSYTCLLYTSGRCNSSSKDNQGNTFKDKHRRSF